MRNARRLATLLLTVVAVPLLPSVVNAAERAPYAPMVLLVDGAANVRDLGGYPVSGGRTIRPGIVYRSGQLGSVTAGGLGALAGLNLAVVADLRSDREINYFGADKVPAGVPVVNERETMPAPTTEDIALSDYRQMVDNADIRAATAATLRLIIAKNGAPVLVNCTGGVDRTGWTMAVLGKILGMSADDVMSDYMYSNTVLGITAAQPQHLQAALDETVTAFGSFIYYVRNGLGLTPIETTKLNQLLTH